MAGGLNDIVVIVGTFSTFIVKEFAFDACGT